MVEIREEQCIGCGICVKDCVGGVLALENGKAGVSGRCIQCGHCVAICPQGAISIPEYDMADVEEIKPSEAKLDAATLLKAIKFRRSIRTYHSHKVEDEKIKYILEAGRYSATAKNTQGTRFILVQKELDTLKTLVWEGIGTVLNLPVQEQPLWGKMLRKFYQQKQADPKQDFLFRNAPAVLFIASDRGDDAGLAAQSMELMSCALELGMLYNGYLVRACDELKEVRNWLEAGEKPLMMCMLLGYLNVTYKRSAPRRLGDFIQK